MLDATEQTAKISKAGFAKIGHSTVQFPSPNELGFQALNLIMINLKIGNFFFHILAWAFYACFLFYKKPNKWLIFGTFSCKRFIGSFLF